MIDHNNEMNEVGLFNCNGFVDWGIGSGVSHSQSIFPVQYRALRTDYIKYYDLD